MKLDAIDIRILSALQENARITNVALAERVGLSPSPCLQRIKKLEQQGVIKGYQGIINLDALSRAVTVYTEITLQNHRREDLLRFEAFLAREDSVLECHMVSGGFDYLVKFTTRHIGHYQEVIEGLLTQELGIIKYFSYIVVKTPIEARPPNLKDLR